MFNTPILDIVIGLLFIFLLYSLLATSIKEGLATVFGLRARMLRRGIIVGMLSNTPEENDPKARLKGFVDSVTFVFKSLFYFIVYRRSYHCNYWNTLGGQFYEHPILKNYGSSGLYPYPSYLPADNFSLILVDTLKKDFENKIEGITNVVFASSSGVTRGQVKADLLGSSDMAKIGQLFAQYRDYYRRLKGDNSVRTCINADNRLIDEETLDILTLYLLESRYDMGAYRALLEIWFQYSMNRVTGWYKRQVQVILFVIGLIMALGFNVDVLEISSRLSKDDKLSEQLVQSAAAYSKSHQDMDLPANEQAEFARKSDEKFQKVDDKIGNDIHDVNGLLALGYGDFGRKDTEFVAALKDKTWYWWRSWHSIGSVHTAKEAAFIADSLHTAYLGKGVSDSAVRAIGDSIFFARQMAVYPLHVRKFYIGYVFWWRRKMIGFLILALAVTLGAPFWFDLLSRFVNLRAAGKKENGSPRTAEKKKAAAAQPAVAVNIQSPNSDQEAAG